MPTKKSFKESATGADKLFSANDAPIEATEQSSEPVISDNTVTNASDIVLTNTSDNIQSNLITNTLSNVKNIILDSIKTEEPAGANYTFYLSAETAAALATTAKEKKISRSKLVDTILKQVLLGEV